MARMKSSSSKTSGENENPESPENTTGKKVKVSGDHRATFAADEYTGGWKIRVIGPNPNRFANRIIPVVRKDGTTTDVQLLGLSWYDESWKDDDTGEHVALYEMQRQRRRLDDEIPF